MAAAVDPQNSTAARKHLLDQAHDGHGTAGTRFTQAAQEDRPADQDGGVSGTSEHKFAA
jgi:hypothetical protein